METAAHPEPSALVYAPRQGVILREIAGESLLVPIRHDVAEMQAIFALVGVGVAVWKLLDGVRTLGAVQDAILAQFDVAPHAAWDDLRDFVAQLEERGLVERRG